MHQALDNINMLSFQAGSFPLIPIIIGLSILALSGVGQVAAEETVEVESILCDCNLEADAPAADENLQAEYEEATGRFENLTLFWEHAVMEAAGGSIDTSEVVPLCEENACAVLKEFKINGYGTLKGKCAVQSHGQYRIRGCLYDDPDDAIKPEELAIVMCDSANYCIDESMIAAANGHFDKLLEEGTSAAENTDNVLALADNINSDSGARKPHEGSLLIFLSMAVSIALSWMVR